MTNRAPSSLYPYQVIVLGSNNTTQPNTDVYYLEWAKQNLEHAWFAMFGQVDRMPAVLFALRDQLDAALVKVTFADEEWVQTKQERGEVWQPSYAKVYYSFYYSTAQGESQCQKD